MLTAVKFDGQRASAKQVDFHLPQPSKGIGNWALRGIARWFRAAFQAAGKETPPWHCEHAGRLPHRAALRVLRERTDSPGVIDAVTNKSPYAGRVIALPPRIYGKRDVGRPARHRTGGQ